jgi:hypothetical protein
MAHPDLILFQSQFSSALKKIAKTVKETHPECRLSLEECAALMKAMQLTMVKPEGDDVHNG